MMKYGDTALLNTVALPSRRTLKPSLQPEHGGSTSVGNCTRFVDQTWGFLEHFNPHSTGQNSDT